MHSADCQKTRDRNAFRANVSVGENKNFEAVINCLSGFVAYLFYRTVEVCSNGVGDIDNLGPDTIFIQPLDGIHSLVCENRRLKKDLATMFWCFRQ